MGLILWLFAVVTNDVNGDVPSNRLLTKHDVTRHHHHHPHQQQSTAVHSRRTTSTEQQLHQRGMIDSLSDVLLTRVFYSGLASDDLCRCSTVCRRWNRLVWNPLLWRCIDLSQSPDCDADAALRSVQFGSVQFETLFREYLTINQSIKLKRLACVTSNFIYSLRVHILAKSRL